RPGVHRPGGGRPRRRRLPPDARAEEAEDRRAGPSPCRDAVMSRGLAFVELTVADWPAAVAWYRDVLGLEVVLRDDVNRFALLGTGPGRVALKAGPSQPGGVLLAFE